MVKNVDIILDSFEYKTKESQFIHNLSDFCSPAFFYTNYENSLIKYFHKLKYIGNTLSHIGYWYLSFCYAFTQLFTLNKTHPKIFINPIVGFFYCFLSTTLRFKREVYMAGFLFEPKMNRVYSMVRYSLVNYSFKNVTKIIVYSRNEIAYYSKLFPRLADKFHFIQYGRDFDVFESAVFECQEKYIASGGFSNRDFETLVNSMRILSGSKIVSKCKIATRPTSFSINCDQNNVQFIYDIRIDRFGSFLDKSSFVIVPLIDTPLSGGHMALLEALYRGKKVIITDIPSVRDYVNDKIVCFYKAGDAENLASKIKEFLDCPASVNEAQEIKSYYSSNFCFARFLTRLVKLTLDENRN